MSPLTEAESRYFLKEYSRIEPDSLPLLRFLDEIYSIMTQQIHFGPQDSLVDIGCGRGYFLDYLQRRGHTELYGLDPCRHLIDLSLHDRIRYGSFQNHPFQTAQFDIAFTCHTLHHLPDREPLFPLREMLRLAKKYIVIVEINNTNLPMLLISLLNRRVERNALWYNKRKIASLLRRAGGEMIYQGDLSAGYISGDSRLYRLCRRLGAPPYNITIARKQAE